MAGDENNGIIREKKGVDGTSKSKDNQIRWWQPSMVLFMRLSGWIAGPVIVALFVGRRLDRKYQTDPWLFLLAVGLAFILSLIGIVRESTITMNKISQSSEKKEKTKRKSRS